MRPAAKLLPELLLHVDQWNDDSEAHSSLKTLDRESSKSDLALEYASYHSIANAVKERGLGAQTLNIAIQPSSIAVQHRYWSPIVVQFAWAMAAADDAIQADGITEAMRPRWRYPMLLLLLSKVTFELA